MKSTYSDYSLIEFKYNVNLLAKEQRGTSITYDISCTNMYYSIITSFALCIRENAEYLKIHRTLALKLAFIRILNTQIIHIGLFNILCKLRIM